MSDTTTTSILHSAQCRNIAADAFDLAEAAAWLADRLDLIRPDAVSRHTLGSHNGISVQCMDADTMARAARALMAGAPVGSITKTTEGNADLGWVRVRRTFGRAFIEAWTTRSELCERVVVGTETVEVPDPSAPKVTVERELVEWRCGSILGGAV